MFFRIVYVCLVQHIVIALMSYGYPDLIDKLFRMDVLCSFVGFHELRLTSYTFVKHETSSSHSPFILRYNYSTSSSSMLTLIIPGYVLCIVRLLISPHTTTTQKDRMDQPMEIIPQTSRNSNTPFPRRHTPQPLLRNHRLPMGTAIYTSHPRQTHQRSIPIRTPQERTPAPIPAQRT